MNLMFKRWFSVVLTALFLLNVSPAAYARVLSLDVCEAVAALNYWQNSGISLPCSAFALSRAIVLYNAIEQINNAAETGFIRDKKILPGWGNFARALMECLPEIDFELEYCLKCCKSVEEIVVSLQNIRLSYLEICNEYEEIHKKRGC